MENLNLVNNLLANQNSLLERIGNLLERQNQSSTSQREIFINDIDRDEMRNGFLVTSHRKKLWNVQIGLINEFDRICKKYNLRWFAFYGTLLGAARHKGFIPWDDDTDVVIFRDDYEKLKKVIDKEIKSPYHMALWCDYSHEADGEISSEYEKTLPLITIQQTKECPMWWPCRTMMRLVDERTTMMNFDARKNLYSGIWLDIFILDFVPPFNDDKKNFLFNVAREFFVGMIYPDEIKNMMNNNQRLTTPYNDMKNFLGLSYRNKGLFLDNFLSKNFTEGQFVDEFRNHCMNPPEIKKVSAQDFEKTVYLPFETIELPVPAGWENCLQSLYGDWHKMIYTHNHSAEYSADIPYNEYHKKSALMG